VLRDPTSPATMAVLELSEKDPTIAAALCATLQRVPPSAIPMSVGSAAVRRLPLKQTEVVQLLDRWEASENAPLRTIVQQGRSAAQKGTARGNVR